MKKKNVSDTAVRILLMEDEAGVANLIQAHLQKNGFVVDVAEDGQKGLELAAAGAYDAMVIDQRMPKVSGLEVIIQLKERGPLPPILVISAMYAEEKAVDALKLGAMDYVVKDAEGRFLETLPAVIRDIHSRHRKAETFRENPEDRNRWLDELRHRVKELGCLYGLEKFLSTYADSLDAALEGVVNLIPNACRLPDLYRIRIKVGDRKFQSADFQETPWKETVMLKQLGNPLGSMEIFATQAPAGQPTLSPGELELIHSLADRIGQFVDHWQTEQELKRSSATLRKLSRAVEQSPNVIMIVNAQEKIEYINPSFTTVTGYTASEVIGKNPDVLKAGDTPLEIYQDLRKTITSGGVWRGEIRNRKKNGEIYWNYATISPITGPGGEITHYVAEYEDITERKKSEQRLAGVIQIATQMAGCLTEDDICRVVVEGIRKYMTVDRCGLFLGHPNNPPFRGTYGTDMNGRTVDEHHRLWDIGKEQDVTDLFAKKSYQSGIPLEQPEAGPHNEGVSATLIALRQRGEVFGIISIDNRITRQPVTEALIMHIALLAEVVGNTLQVARARETVRISAEETRRAYDEVEAFNRAMVGRENRIIELKEEINRLLAELSRPVKYPPVWATPGKEVTPDMRIV